MSVCLSAQAHVREREKQISYTYILIRPPVAFPSDVGHAIPDCIPSLGTIAVSLLSIANSYIVHASSTTAFASTDRKT